MSVIIDQLVQERVMGGTCSVPTSHRSGNDGKRGSSTNRGTRLAFDDMLPEDVAALQQLVCTLQDELQEARSELDRINQDNGALQTEYAALWVWGVVGAWGGCAWWGGVWDGTAMCALCVRHPRYCPQHYCLQIRSHNHQQSQNQVHHVCYLNGTSAEQFFANASSMPHHPHGHHHMDSLTYTGEPRLSPHSLDGASGHHHMEDRTSPNGKGGHLHVSGSGSHEDVWAGLGMHNAAEGPVAAHTADLLAVPVWDGVVVVVVVCQGGLFKPECSPTHRQMVGHPTAHPASHTTTPPPITTTQEGATSALREVFKQGGFDVCLTAVAGANVAVTVDVTPMGSADLAAYVGGGKRKLHAIAEAPTEVMV